MSELGYVLSVTGVRATIRLSANRQAYEGGESRVTIGKLIAILTPASLVVGVVSRVIGSRGESDLSKGGEQTVDTDFLGEIMHHGSPGAFFQRGVSQYPAVGDKMNFLATEDISLIHRIAENSTIDIGHLQMDAAVPAYVNFDELLQKHFAILGTAGVGKSSGVALILRQVLQKKPNLRVFLIDPHNEYGHCFGDMSKVVSPKNLKLPFWLFNFEEIVDVFFRARPGAEGEKEILQELIPVAKARYAAASRGDRLSLRKSGGGGFTADTPVPYRISDLIALINERMGKLENRSSVATYNSLMTRIETLSHDARYSFMFSSLLVEDMMAKVLSDLFGLAAGSRPITVMQLAGFPAEVVDSVVSVLCRLAFEFGVWSDGAVPLLVACEESHRYAPADRKLGFGPTRKSLSRIAKEGRKYCVFLGIVTQRPADLDPTILSQCSTVFAMRMANDRDQAIVKSAVPDAGSSLVEVLASLGTREAIAFGEGVALPTRLRFGDVASEFLPRSQIEGRARFDAADAIDADFVEAVVDRWRESSTTGAKPRVSAALASDESLDLDDGFGLVGSIIKQR